MDYILSHLCNYNSHSIILISVLGELNHINRFGYKIIPILVFSEINYIITIDSHVGF